MEFTNELTKKVWQDKYCYKNETTEDFFNRITNAFIPLVPFIDNENLSEYGRKRISNKSNYRNTLFNYLSDFKIIPGGSVLANAGTENLSSLSNCFVINTKDSIDGIFSTAKDMSQISKRRGGIGFDLSVLRPSGAPVKNAAKTTTGVVPFMELFSQVINTIGQSGRRGALMLSIDVNHPDVLAFITSKQDLSKITGANISVKLNKEFIVAAQKDEDYYLKWNVSSIEKIDVEDLKYNILYPYKKGYIKKVKAKSIWEAIVECAWKTAEPGILFWDNVIEQDPASVYPEFKAVSTNPCGEIPLSPYDSCRLIAINIYKNITNPFTSEAKFNEEKFYQTCYEGMLLGNALVDLEIKAIRNIQKSVSGEEQELWKRIEEIGIKGRRTGMGLTGYGDACAALGLKYGDSIFTKRFMYIKMKAELDATIDLAITQGTFPSYDKSLEKSPFYDFLKSEFPEQYARMQKFGRRNVSWSTVPPAGTISILAGCSSGIEPVFQLMYTRRKKCNPGEVGNFTDVNGVQFKEYYVVSDTFKEWLKITKGINDIDSISKEQMDIYVKESPWYKNLAEDINPDERIRTQALIQRYTTHSISSTINLPSTTTIEDIADIYKEAIFSGCKGVTVYRDGCRDGILIKENQPKKETFEFNKLKPLNRKELGDKLYGVSYKKTNACGGLYITINNTEDGNIVEVFTNPTKHGGCKANLEALTRQISDSMRSGISLETIIESLSKVPCQACIRAKAKGEKIDGLSCSDIISQCIASRYKELKGTSKELKKIEIKNNIDKSKCPNCGAPLRAEGGCYICYECGYSKCD